MVQCVGPTLREAEIKKYQEKYGFYPDLEEMAEFYNLMSHPIRLKVVHLLRVFKEVCVCDLKEIFGVTASSLSQHLAKLKAHKMVTSRKDAQTVFYSLTDNPLLETIPAAP